MISKSKTVDSYIAQFPNDVQKRLKELRVILKKAAPGATEGLKWGEPAFSYDRVLFIFGGYKDHVSFYPTPRILKAFKKDLAKLKTSAAAVQFPLDKPIPKAVVKKLALARVKDLKENDAKWM